MAPSPIKKRLIGYARVSTEDQAHDAQLDELRAAGCAEIHQEHGSGASRARPVLARLMREIRRQSPTLCENRAFSLLLKANLSGPKI